MAYLRLDLYINGKEYLVWESDEATAAEYDRAVRNASIVFQRCDDTLKSNGFVYLNAGEIEDEDMQQVLYEFTDRDIKSTDEVLYVMCLWQRNEDDEAEHIREQVKFADFE